MNNISTVVSVNISSGGIPKKPIVCVRILSSGLQGDGHHHAKHCRLEQAVSFQDVEKLAELRSEGYPLYCGAIGENISVANLNVNSLPLGTILNFSGGVQLEITKIRNPCYVLDAIHPRLKEVIVGRCGMYAKVLREGMLRSGEAIEAILPVPVPQIYSPVALH